MTLPVKGELLHERFHLCLHSWFPWQLPSHSLSRVEWERGHPFLIPCVPSDGVQANVTAMVNGLCHRGHAMLSTHFNSHSTAATKHAGANQSLKTTPASVAMKFGRSPKGRTNRSSLFISVSCCRNKRCCNLGNCHSRTLQDQSSLLVANPVDHLCTTRTRFLWTARWKALWIAFPQSFRASHYFIL
jgi:hypothetical protein